MASKILIVDDEPDMELLIRQRFRREIDEGAYTFQFAHQGEEALAAIQSDPAIEVVLTDINMPVMDGLTLLTRLNEQPNPPATVIVSAYGDMPNIRAAMNRGAFDFLTKPLDFQDVEVTIRKTLTQVHRLRDAQADHDRLVALERDLAIAAQIQRSFLPHPNGEVVNHSAFAVHACMFPAQAVGGDFYDYFFLDADRLGVVIGDVSGKGVPAALLMAMTRSLLRASALRGGEPAACLEEVNRLILRDTATGRFVTLFYGLLDAKRGQLRYANAGHSPPFLLHREGPLQQMRQTDLILGAMPEAHYQTREMQLVPGDRLFLYTDGVSEAMNPAKQQFAEERLQQVLGGSRNEGPEQLIGRVVEAVRQFTANAPQADDLTALAVLYRGPVGEQA